MANDMRTTGPECAVLTSRGTVYLYRLTATDLRAFRDLPATKLSPDKVRVLLGRVASLHVSDKGILDAGTLAADEVASLDDDEIERIAEAWLESTTVRWYRHEGASATLSVIRNPDEPATKFLDRLIHWYATRGPGSNEREEFSAALPHAKPRRMPAETIELSKREAWIALGALAVLVVLGLGAILQNYLLVHALQRQQDALIAQVKDTNALLAQHVSRASAENAELRRRLEEVEARLRAPAPAKVVARPAPPAKSATTARKAKPRR